MKRIGTNKPPMHDGGDTWPLRCIPDCGSLFFYFSLDTALHLLYRIHDLLPKYHVLSSDSREMHRFGDWAAGLAGRTPLAPWPVRGLMLWYSRETGFPGTISAKVCWLRCATCSDLSTWSPNLTRTGLSRK